MTRGRREQMFRAHWIDCPKTWRRAATAAQGKQNGLGAVYRRIHCAKRRVSCVVTWIAMAQSPALKARHASLPRAEACGKALWTTSFTSSPHSVARMSRARPQL